MAVVGHLHTLKDRDVFKRGLDQPDGGQESKHRLVKTAQMDAKIENGRNSGEPIPAPGVNSSWTKSAWETERSEGDMRHTVVGGRKAYNDRTPASGIPMNPDNAPEAPQRLSNLVSGDFRAKPNARLNAAPRMPPHTTIGASGPKENPNAVTSRLNARNGAIATATPARPSSHQPHEPWSRSLKRPLIPCLTAAHVSVHPPSPVTIQIHIGPQCVNSGSRCQSVWQACLTVAEYTAPRAPVDEPASTAQA